MSIRDIINRIEGHSLFCSPWAGEDETPRTVFASQEVAEKVTPPFPETRDGRQYAALRGLFDSFTSGDFITVAQNPFRKSPTAVLARVHPVGDEVWDFRCLDPRPGIRAFGSFAEIDTFVALTYTYREILDEDDDDVDYWAEEIAHCKNEWSRLFGPHPPLRGVRLNEYISYNFRAV